MAANSVRKCVACVGHVTVVAEASTGVGSVMGMFFNAISKGSMTLQTCFVGFHALAQLIV